MISAATIYLIILTQFENSENNGKDFAGNKTRAFIM